MGDNMENKKLTALEKQWILYDVGNSAFILLVATIMPIYFNSLCQSAGIAEVDYLAYWGYAASVSTLIVALSGPVLGTLADYQGLKKKIFALCVMVGVCALAALWIPTSWRVFLILYIVAKVGYSASLIFYDSMLSDVTTPERMDRVSSHGYAWGYIGSCVPFVISLVFVLFYEQFSMTIMTAMILAFVINALWWLACTLPLLKNYKQNYYVEDTQKDKLRGSFRRLADSFRKIRKHRKIFLFLIAFFFYIDGVYTIIDMATAYGSALGLDTQGDADRRVSQRTGLRSAGPQNQQRQADSDLYSGVYRNRGLRDPVGQAMGVLGAGGMRRFVPGRHSSVVPILFCADHSAGKCRRILRPVRYLRQRCGLSGHSLSQSDGAAFRQCQRRDCDSGSDVYYRSVFVQPRAACGIN